MVNKPKARTCTEVGMEECLQHFFEATKSQVSSRLHPCGGKRYVTNTKFLRSRMKGNFHVRFWSRAERATSSLRLAPISPCFSYGRGDGYSASLSASEVLHPNPPANKLRASIKNPLKWVENWAFHGKRRTYRLKLIPENCLPPIIKCAPLLYRSALYHRGAAQE